VDDFSHALDEQRPARNPVRAIGLEAPHLIESGADIGRDLIRVDLMRHSPVGEPVARHEQKVREAPVTVHVGPRFEEPDRIRRIVYRGGMCPARCRTGHGQMQRPGAQLET
jgi:hypothetical protein